MSDEDVATIAARNAIANYLYPCRADDLVAARAAVKAARPVIEAEARAAERQRIRDGLTIGSTMEDVDRLLGDPDE